MSKPNRSDLRRLKSIQIKVENLISAFSGLSEQTEIFLREEFIGETSIKLRDFSQNISEAITLIQFPIK